MNTKLIGWPSASGQGTWETVGKSDLSTIILSGTTGNLGDITGKGAGAARAARAVGVGEDEEIRRAARELDLLARSAWVGELIASERSLGAALMLLAGGREFLAGMSVRLNGNGMTPRAARLISSSSPTPTARAARAAPAPLPVMSPRLPVVPDRIMVDKSDLPIICHVPRPVADGHPISFNVCIVTPNVAARSGLQRASLTARFCFAA